MDPKHEYRSRTDWLQLLHECQDGHASCLFVLKEIERITIVEEQRQSLLGCIDTLGTALATHGHTWTNGERAIYEEACEILGAPEQEPPTAIA